MAIERTAAAGAIGGAAAETGSEYRARVGALLATTLIRRTPLDDVGLNVGSVAIPRLLQAETDDPVDDLLVTLDDDTRVFVQAKHAVRLRRERDAPFGAALRQFAEAVRGELNDGDRLVLACARPSGPVRDLQHLLDQRRHVTFGDPLPRDATAWNAFGDVARACGLGVDELYRVAQRLIIWETNPMVGDGDGMLIARLDGHVVPAGRGRDAARDLTDEVRALARARAGHDALGLAQALSRRGYPPSSLATPTSPMASAQALDNYRARAVREGTTLRLFGAPAEFSDLPFDVADAGIRVIVPEDDRRLGDAWLPALRRRGRVLLVGDPGGGKSTALRTAAAHWAHRPGHPTPILVHLERLARRPREMLDALLDAAVGHVAGGERAALHAALAHELRHGRCLLLLDGLDEVRRGRPALVADLVRFLEDLHEGVEVVIATRPVAIEDARPLGLPELELHPPDHPGVTINAILRAAAPAESPEPWMAERRGWIDASIERDVALGRTPLTIVVLALIAVRSDDPDNLPRSRAKLLHRALMDVVDRWEVEARRRGVVEAGGLSLADARQAIAVTLRVLSCAVVSAAGVDAAEVRARVASVLLEQFGLAPGTARGAAEESITFWTEVGLFSLDGGALVARIRQFAELGHAWGPALDGTPEPSGWIADARRSSDLWASLALGAGLSATIAQQWAEALAADGGADELIAFVEAVCDGVQVTQEVLSVVARDAAARHLAHERDAERVAEALLLLPLAPEMRRELRPALTASVPTERKAVVDALTIVRWNESGPDVDERLRRLVTAPVAPPPADLRRPEDSELFWPPGHDETYNSALEGGMLRVLALSREDAEQVSERFSDGSREFRNQLEAAFAHAGHADLSEKVNQDLRDSHAKTRELYDNSDFNSLVRAMLGMVADLARPAYLTPIELRRLDALADLFATASLNWTHSGWEARRPATAAGWIRAMAELGGFDLGVLAAQAGVLLEDMLDDDDVRHLAFDLGTSKEPRHWDRVADPDATLRALVDAIGYAPSAASREMMLAVATAPDHAQAVALLERRVERVRIWARALAAKTLLLAEAEGVGKDVADARAGRWLEGDDPMLREAAAMWWAFSAVTTSVPGGQLGRCLSDPDRNVANEVVRWLRPDAVDDALRQRLEALRAAPPETWLCRWCGQENGPGQGSNCSNCPHNAPRIRETVTELLQDGSKSRLQFGRSPYRLRRVRASRGMP